jgi:CubicO group peptidase (beta-lactamase class C family)
VDVSRPRALLAEAIAAGAAPAAVIDVGGADTSMWQDAFGRLSTDPAAPPASLDTIFDLASLTKVIAMADGHLDLDTPVGDVLDGWRAGGRGAVRVRHLLDHSSGLPAHLRLWEQTSGRAAYEAVLRSVPLEAAPGTRAVYSDPGFIVLGFVLETVGGGPLDRLFAAREASWHGALMFTPDAALSDRIAPTGADLATGRPDVHDENARALGGVAGHAGLFGTAVEVGAFARLVLRTFRERTPLASPALMRAFATPSAVPGSSRALAWDTMRPTSSCGRLLSPTAIGHTGFTGTSLWIDPDRGLYVVLLTNRVHPVRTNEALPALRPLLHDAIVSCLDPRG